MGIMPGGRQVGRVLRGAREGERHGGADEQRGGQAGRDQRRHEVVSRCSSLLPPALGGSTAAWEIPIGADRAQVFAATAFVPGFYSYTAVAVAGRAHEVLVVPVHLHLERSRPDPQPRSRAPDPSQRLPVFALDRTSGGVARLTRGQFLERETLAEDLPQELASRHPELALAGSRSQYAVARPEGDRAYVAAESWESEERSRLTFGLPSLIPFMGRQEFFERRTFHSGTRFLEVFDSARPQVPVIRFSQRFRNHTTVPLASEFAAWVQGAAEPVLVLVDPGEPRRRAARFYVVEVRPRE